jgi:hypothetical protein
MATVDLDHMSRNGAPPVKGEPIHRGANWWKAKEDEELAGEIVGGLEFMRTKQSLRLSQWIIATRLYGNQALTNKNAVSFSSVAVGAPWLRDRISWNIVQAVCDTVVSRMIKNKPKPIFLTNGGDYKMQRRAKKLNEFTEGVFYENKVSPQLGPQAALDATVWGDGVIHVYEENGRVKFERVIPSELWVDEFDGFYGEPRNMHRVTDIDRHVLLELVEQWTKDEPPKKREEILAKVKNTPPSSPDQSADYLADKVTVAESWHLPSKEGGTDGVHALTIKDCVLHREKWEHDCFPFAFLTWSDRLTGFWGQGAAEQLQNLQFEINTLLQTIKQSFWKGGTFRVFLPQGSRLVKEHFTNQIGPVMTYSGDKPPTVVTPALVQTEIFQHLENLWRKGFEQSGVSQLSAASVKPPGLDSGVAMREYNDIQSDRFMRFGQRYEEFFLDLARLAIMTVKDITKGGRSYKVKVPLRGNAMKEVDWKDVNLTDDEYVMRAFPISSLPQDPAGRMQTVVEMVQAGWITARQGRRLLDFPDLDMANSLATAAEDYLTDILEQMLEDEGKYVAPEPYDDLALARELALETYQRGKVQHVPDDRLDLIRRFLTHLDQYEAAAKIGQAMSAQLGTPPPGPTAGPSPGGGEAPPNAGRGGIGPSAGTVQAKPPQAPQGALMPNSVVSKGGGQPPMLAQ